MALKVAKEELRNERNSTRIHTHYLGIMTRKKVRQLEVLVTGWADRRRCKTRQNSMSRGTCRGMKYPRSLES